MSEKMSIPGAWTPEQLKNQAERVKSDAKLISKGAEYTVKVKNQKNPRLDVTQKEKDRIYAEREATEKEKTIIKEIKILEAEVREKITTFEEQFLSPEKIKLEFSPILAWGVLVVVSKMI